MQIGILLYFNSSLYQYIVFTKKEENDDVLMSIFGKYPSKVYIYIDKNKYLKITCVKYRYGACSIRPDEYLYERS